MKPKDIFSLAVRLLGLIFLYHGIQSLPALMSANFFLIVYIVMQFVMAWWLVGGATLLVDRAYPTESSAPTDAKPEIKSGN